MATFVRAFDLLDRQANAVTDGARAFSRIVNDDGSAEDSASSLLRATEQSISARDELENILERTLSAPIEREDLHRLSAQFDRAFASTSRSTYASLERHPSTTTIRAIATELVTSSEKLASSVGALRDAAYGRLLDVARELRATVKQARMLHAHALRDLAGAEAAAPRDLFRDAALLDAIRGTLASYHAVAGELSHLAVKNA